jgi:flagellar hook protein FlgE
MSLSSAMYTGVSGLLNNGQAMNVIGNNISNVNTTGFKAGRTLFSDLLSENVSTTSQVGTGVKTQAVQDVFTQGSTQSSENITDLAIQGNSFFALKSPTVATGGQDTAYLSRAGAFTVDKDLTLVNPDGYQVLDTSGQPIKFSDNAAGISTSVTTLATDAALAKTAINTDTATVTTAMGTPNVNQTAALAALTSANTTLTAALSTLTASPNAANAKVVADATAAAHTALQAAATSVSAAVLASLTSNATTATVATDVTTVAGQQAIAFSKITNIDTSGLISYLGGDGQTQCYYKASGVAGVPVTTASTAASATYDGIAIVTAKDPAALTKVGGSLYRSTIDSGVSAAAFSQSANRANSTSEQILSNSLEQSNVDMASEFVKMIVTQRAYSANSKTITTTDQMTQEVLGLIR